MSSFRMPGKDASSIRMFAVGAIAALAGLFWSPAGVAEACAARLGRNVQILNVAPASPNVSRRVTERLRRRDPRFINSLPNLSTVLNEAVEVSREDHANLSVALEYTATDRDVRPSVRLSLDVPNHPADPPPRRFEGVKPEGRDETVARFDIRIKSDEILVTPAESVGVRTSRGVFVPEATNHRWGVAIVDPPNEDIIIDTRGMRAELYVGDESQTLDRRALGLALRIAQAIQPHDRVLLQSRRAVHERKDGEWRPLPAAR